MAADFHTVFNIALALLFVFVLDGVARLLVWLLPDSAKQLDPAVPFYLDEAAMQTPSVALAWAARGTLDMGGGIEGMLKQAMAALLDKDRQRAAGGFTLDNVVHRPG